MAFTPLATIDAFGRTEDPLATGWAAAFAYGGGREFEADGSHAISTQAAGTSVASYWTTIYPFADSQIWAKFSAIPTGSYWAAILLRVQDPSLSTWSGYRVYIYASTFTLVRHISSDTTLVTSTSFSPALANGDTVALEIIGTTLRVWLLHGGSWTVQATYSDNDAAAMLAPGYLVIQTNDSAMQFDEVGGGPFAYPSISGSTPGLLAVSGDNGRYLETGGTPVFLAGAYSSAMQCGYASVEEIDYPAWLTHMASHGHNCFRFMGWTGESTAVLHVPMPWTRPGPGTAADGRLLYDLDVLNDEYFNRLRYRVIEAGNAGFYVMVCLFSYPPYPYTNDPMNENNNVDAVDGDTNSDGYGVEEYDGSVSAITTIQEAFVEKMVDTLYDLDNVIWEIQNEGPVESGCATWQSDIMDHLRTYESGKAQQHPVCISWQGTTGTGLNSTIFALTSDCVGPGIDNVDDYVSDPPAASGSKVVIADTDHIHPGDNVDWVWRSTTRGIYTIMYDDGTSGYEAGRLALGHAITYASCLDLRYAIPSGASCSTGYLLAWTGHQYLAYQPGSGVFSISFPSAASYTYEWVDVTDGSIAESGTVAVTAGANNFTPPSSDAQVLLLLALGQPAYGYATPVSGESAISWTTWKDASGDPPSVSGDPDYGDMVSPVATALYSPVIDSGNGNNKRFTITCPKYGSNSGIVAVACRGSASSFAWDAVSPSWTAYSVPIQQAWRYFQVRVTGEGYAGAGLLGAGTVQMTASGSCSSLIADLVLEWEAAGA